jgi:hypothetical protein
MMATVVCHPAHYRSLHRSRAQNCQEQPEAMACHEGMVGEVAVEANSDANGIEQETQAEN